MRAALSLTHRCNLACSYCYSGKAVNKDMSLATACKIVDFIVDITPQDRRIELGFFGGEPLLRFSLIREIVDYIRDKERQTARAVCLRITTNGTLLDQSILDFLKKESIGLCISIDGPAHIHDLNRTDKNGRGSFTRVVENLGTAIRQLSAVQVNAVYGPDTIDYLPHTVQFLANMGACVIHLNPNIQATWTEDTCRRFSDIFMQIADYYIQAYQQDEELAVNFIDSKIVLFLKGGYAPQDMCGMGETEWGFAAGGNIYPCERFIGEDTDQSLCLGNIHTGLETTRRCAILEGRGNRNKECKTCKLVPYCMNWCGCTNYYMTGSTNLTGPALCWMERAAIGSAKHVLTTLSELDNELFLSHFMRYISESCDH